MTYKEAVNKFQTRYRQLCLMEDKKEIKLDATEILMHLSEVQADLGNRYKLVRKESDLNTTPQVNLVSGQDKYTVGTGATNLPNDMLEIFLVTLNDTMKTVLLKTEPQQMFSRTKSSGLPGAYSIKNSNQVLELDMIPDQSYNAVSAASYRLILYYYQKLFTYDGTATNTFSDLNFSSSNWGGSFKLDSIWDTVLIQGVLGMFFPEQYELYHQMVSDMAATAPEYFDTELRSYAGISINPIETLQPGQDPPRW